jgi:hypothetical protein
MHTTSSQKNTYGRDSYGTIIKAGDSQNALAQARPKVEGRQTIFFQLNMTSQGGAVLNEVEESGRSPIDEELSATYVLQRQGC